MAMGSWRTKPFFCDPPSAFPNSTSFEPTCDEEVYSATPLVPIRHEYISRSSVKCFMTITSRVKDELFETDERRPIRLAPTFVQPRSSDDDLPAIKSRGIPWSEDEHERFLDALAQYPYGPWKKIAELIGTRTARQAMSHAQKYRQKINRRKRYVAKQKSKQDKEQSPASAGPTRARAITGPASQQTTLSSRYEMPPPEVPRLQAYVDTSELPFGTSFAETERTIPATSFAHVNAFDAVYPLFWNPMFVRAPATAGSADHQTHDESDFLDFVV
ncbi:Atp-binding protein, partial [Globisporangium splendens]